MNNTVRTYPNLLWILMNLFFLSFFGAIILVFFVSLFGINKFIKDINDAPVGATFFLIFISLIFVYYYYQLSNHFTFAKITFEGITVFQLMKFRIKTMPFEEIRGYSNSEVYYGEVPLHFKSKSIVIYSKDKNQFELIKLCNFNFENFKNTIKQSEIIYLGKEDFQSGFYKRKYKYINK